MKRVAITWNEFLVGLQSGMYKQPDADYTRLRIRARQLRGLVNHVSTVGVKPWTAWHRHQSRLRARLSEVARLAECEFEQYCIANGFPKVLPWKPRNWATVKRQLRQADLGYRPTKRRRAA